MDDEFIPPAVAISSIEVPFWNLVTFAIKFWFAQLVAFAIIAGLAFLLTLLNVVSYDAIRDRFD